LRKIALRAAFRGWKRWYISGFTERNAHLEADVQVSRINIEKRVEFNVSLLRCGAGFPWNRRPSPCLKRTMRTRRNR